MRQGSFSFGLQCECFRLRLLRQRKHPRANAPDHAAFHHVGEYGPDVFRFVMVDVPADQPHRLWECNDLLLKEGVKNDALFS